MRVDETPNSEALISHFIREHSNYYFLQVSNWYW